MNLYTGCIENRKDPLKLGRCQVRVVGLHTHDKTILPTEDLPWAYPMQPVTSAAMNGIGVAPVGVVEGTWVVIMFRDAEHQQPIILGSIGGIPQDESKAIDDDEDDSISIDIKPPKVEATPAGNVVTDGSGSVVTDGSGNPVTTGTQPNPSPASSTDSTATQVKAVPPPSPRAKPGIDALNAEMDRQGIKGKYGRAAILAIAMGESGCVPQAEGYYYSSAASLMKVFGYTFGNKPDLAEKYAKWKGTRESFFDLVYAPENNGRSLGNNQPGDGGKFYGRGFIQITGRSNYAIYAKLTGVDILSQPDLLNTDYAVSAAVTVQYMKRRVSADPTDPGYFEKALRAVGNDGGGYNKKRGYYKYFLGDDSPTPEQTDKSTNKGEDVQSVPIAENGLPKDRQKNLVNGFNDPNMKYPLRNYIGEPDTNRLARGKITGTVVEYKDQKRLEGVETANGFEWSQPDIPFNARYPYNKVMETESGHLLEFDDTPENERIHMYHRKGTYTEIDANGSQVNRIVGDGYYIMERNGYVFIGGDCNVTVNGTARILVEADAFIDVTGDTKINMAGDADISVANDLSMRIGGEFKLSAANIKMDSNSDFNVTADGANKLTSSGGFHANAGGEAKIEGSTVHLAEGADSASAAGLPGAVSQGTKNSRTFEQLKPPPRNLEEELSYETPEENEDPKAKKYHEERATPTTSDKAVAVESTPAPENKKIASSVDCDIISGMTSFPESYVLYTDSTGYKWTMGKLTKGRTISTVNWKNGKVYSVQEIVCNLKGLCVNILGPVNEMVGPVDKAWYLTSCFRNDPVAGSVLLSPHLIGTAADVSIGGNYGYKVNYDWAVKFAATLPIDQLLLEYRDPGVNGSKDPKRINWIHLGHNSVGTNRKQVLTFLNDKTHSQGLTNLGAA